MPEIKLTKLEQRMFNRVKSLNAGLNSNQVSGNEKAALNRLVKKGIIKRQPWQRCFSFLPEADNTMINKYVYFV